ncbi:MAG TPA: hypothetical protein VNG71_08690 [Pyrinomonadaceae bacterium]|nr:hypothetical protein [Pyrinomonadaceae bacterium]
MPQHDQQTLRPIDRRRLSIFSIAAIALVGALSIFGCSKGGGGGLHVKSAPTGEKDVATKSGSAFAVTKTFTDVAGKMTTASSYRTYVANYDLDSANFALTLDKPLTSDDAVRVTFSLVGEEGTKEASPPKAGTYSAKADKYMKVEDVSIVSRKGGADNKFFLDRSTLNGQVKVTTATADEIAGDIDLSSGDNVIKGSFTAKVLKRK